MIPTVATADALLELTHDLERIRSDLEARFVNLGHFEAFLMSEQTTWDEPNLVRRVIALHNVEARVSLTSEAVDGFVRVELQDGSRVNWRFFYLKEAGFSTPPFEDFWLEPIRSEGNQNAVC